MSDIFIVDYGMANLRSVQKAFEKVGHAASITGDPDRMAEADKLVLPGVGAFRDAIARLHEAGLVQPIVEHVHERQAVPWASAWACSCCLPPATRTANTPAWICSRARWSAFPSQPGLKVPHMGWNQLRIRKPAPAPGRPGGRSLRLLRPFLLCPSRKTPALVATETDYPTPFASMIWHENVFATQFHPEKSQHVGLEMLRRFGEW